MLVVDTKAVGREILARSICAVCDGFLTLWLRVGGDVGSFTVSERLMRFVMARASDILMDQFEIDSQILQKKGPVLGIRAGNAKNEGSWLLLSWAAGLRGTVVDKLHFERHEVQ